MILKKKHIVIYKIKRVPQNEGQTEIKLTKHILVSVNPLYFDPKAQSGGCCLSNVTFAKPKVYAVCLASHF